MRFCRCYFLQQFGGDFVPAIENSRDVKVALRAVANAVAEGGITSAQGLRLVRLYTEIYRYL